jgi:hypothetical protein
MDRRNNTEGVLMGRHGISFVDRIVVNSFRCRPRYSACNGCFGIIRATMQLYHHFFHPKNTIFRPKNTTLNPQAYT